MREAPIKEKFYSDEELPCEATIGNILNRLEYNLKRALKAKTAKKSKRLMKYLKMYGKQMKSLTKTLNH